MRAAVPHTDELLAGQLAGLAGGAGCHPGGGHDARRADETDASGPSAGTDRAGDRRRRQALGAASRPGRRWRSTSTGRSPAGSREGASRARWSRSPSGVIARRAAARALRDRRHRGLGRRAPVRWRDRRVDPGVRAGTLRGDGACGRPRRRGDGARGRAPGAKLSWRPTARGRARSARPSSTTRRRGRGRAAVDRHVRAARLTVRRRRRAAAPADPVRRGRHRRAPVHAGADGRLAAVRGRPASPVRHPGAVSGRRSR